MAIGFQFTHSRRVHAVLAYLNGQYLPRSAATISVDDRGFIFGDGVYEVWRVVNGRLFELDRHLRAPDVRLARARIAAPDITRADVLARVAGRLLRESGLDRGRGDASIWRSRAARRRARTSFPPAGTAPTVFATVNRFTPADELRRTRRRGDHDSRHPLAALRHQDAAAAAERAGEAGRRGGWRDGCADGSRRHGHGRFARQRARGARRRRFARTRRTISSCRESREPSCSRSRASSGIAVREEAFAERDLPRLDELFLAGTTTDVMPIVRVNDTVIGERSAGADREAVVHGVARPYRCRLLALGCEQSFAPAPA